ncbi:DRAP deaminase [Coemansia sp. RSA 2599]|nr:DRAP deaminase [Coemansia sp. RSA 2598]KAJ1829111.1 DRAP deaminase [Coemansia sp. RSA 2599]
MTESRKHDRPDSRSEGNTDRKRQKKQNKIEKPEDPNDPETVYYESDGLQRIHPYFYNFATYAKGRWVGRTIFEVFSKEFRDRPVDYYLKAIKQGLIEINGQRVDKDTVVRNSDVVTHYIHRHEPPVTVKPLGIVENVKDGLLLVDKPGSIPVHPTGRYNYNSVTKILKIKHGYTSLYPVNRLDRLTSGLMLVGLNPDVARRMERDLTSHRIQKEYVCKVKGVFPQGKIVCDQPIRVVAHKLSLNCVDPEDGKPSLTEFELLSTDGTNSIVYCRPKTGRTHQIRVHLQFLGYPIANDPLYCNREVWGESLGRNGVFPKYDADIKDDEKEAAEEERQSTTAGTGEARPKMSGKRDADNIEPWMDLVKRMEEWKTKQELIEQISNSVDTQGVPRVCDKCTDPVLPDPKPEELCIWLHAWRYSGPGWSYETPLPEWAVEAKQHIDRVKYVPEESG